MLPFVPQLAKAYGMDFFETSAFTNHNITEVRWSWNVMTKHRIVQKLSSHYDIMGGNDLISHLVLLLWLRFPARLLHDWLNRCWQPIRRIWIYSECPSTTSLISLLWRKRRDSVTVQPATNTKAAGVKETTWILTEHLSSPHTLRTLGKMCLILF